MAINVVINSKARGCRGKREWDQQSWGEGREELAWERRWNSLSPGEEGGADYQGTETYRGTGERKWERLRGRTFTTIRKQDSEFPVNNGRGREIHKQKESKYLFPICHSYSIVSPTKSSSSLLGSLLIAKSSVMGLAYSGHSFFKWMNGRNGWRMDEKMDGRKGEWKNGYKERWVER